MSDVLLVRVLNCDDILEDHILHNKIGVKRNEGATATTTEEKGEKNSLQT
jgi:hypothetical protein